MKEKTVFIITIRDNKDGFPVPFTNYLQEISLFP